MILMRLNDLGGLYCSIHGGQPKYKYGETGAGWLPVESVQFGFESVAESSVGATTAAAGGQRGASPARPAATGGGAAAGATKKEGDDSLAKLSISRFVDSATSSLMGFAMEDRKAKKSDRSKMREADIHFLHSVKTADESKPRYIFPYLMITLESVLLKGWNMSAQADDRPTENLDLWFDKVAVMYYRTVDGKTWIGGDVNGWDGYVNEPWSPKDREFFKQPDVF